MRREYEQRRDLWNITAACSRIVQECMLQASHRRRNDRAETKSIVGKRRPSMTLCINNKTGRFFLKSVTNSRGGRCVRHMHLDKREAELVWTSWFPKCYGRIGLGVMARLQIICYVTATVAGRTQQVCHGRNLITAKHSTTPPRPLSASTPTSTIQLNVHLTQPSRHNLSLLKNSVFTRSSTSRARAHSIASLKHTPD